MADDAQPEQPNLAAALITSLAAKPEPEEAPKKKNKMMFIAIGVVVFFIVVAIIVAATSGGDDDGTGGGGGDDGLPASESNPKKITGDIIWYQPAEEKGSYNVRSVTMSACEAISKHCLTCDDLVGSDGGHPLKWDKHVYFGRITLPKGVKVTMKALGGGWDGYCGDRTDGNEPTVVTGPVTKKDVWNYDYRYCCFIIEAMPNYYC